MRHVRFDEVAARRAAAACRDGAQRLRALARPMSGRLARMCWEGGAARRALVSLHCVAGSLHDEADALERTAERIERALAEARQLDGRRRDAVRAATAVTRTPVRRASPRPVSPYPDLVLPLVFTAPPSASPSGGRAASHVRMVR